MTDVATLAAKDSIAARIYDLFLGTDQRDWSRVRACFTERVHFDMTSVAGGAAQDLTPMQITDAWHAGLAPLDHIHHQAGNLQIHVESDSATASCYGIALHYRATKSGDNVRRFVGTYDFTLRRVETRWLISAFRFNVKFVDGNLSLETAP